MIFPLTRTKPRHYAITYKTPVTGKWQPDTLIWFADNEDRTGELYGAFGMEGHCETVRIPGVGLNKQYAIFVSPFCK